MAKWGCCTAEAFNEPEPGALPDVQKVMQGTIEVRAEGIQLWQSALEEQ